MPIVAIEELDLAWVVRRPDGNPSETMPANPELILMMLGELDWLAFAFGMDAGDLDDDRRDEGTTWTNSASR